MKYNITVKTTVDVDETITPKEIADSIKVYAGTKLDLNLIDIQRDNQTANLDEETLKDMSRDQVLDNSIKEFVIAAYSLTNALDQTHVTPEHQRRIKNVMTHLLKIFK